MLSSDGYIHFFHFFFFSLSLMLMRHYQPRHLGSPSHQTSSERHLTWDQFSPSSSDFCFFFWFSFLYSFEQVDRFCSCKKFQRCFENRDRHSFYWSVPLRGGEGGGRKWIHTDCVCEIAAVSVGWASEKGNNSAAITRLAWRESYSVGSEENKVIWQV